MVPLPRTTTTTTGNAIQKAKKIHQAPPKQTPPPHKKYRFRNSHPVARGGYEPKNYGYLKKVYIYTKGKHARF